MNIETMLGRTGSNSILSRADKPFGWAAVEPGKIGEKQDFQAMLKNAINDVNQLQNDSDKQIGSLLKGESQDIHGTILAVQQADTSFKMMMQVRSKIVEAYKEIARSGM